MARLHYRGDDDAPTATEITGELLIGRIAQCQIATTDSTVTRRHARVRRHGPRWVLEDLDSDNGTYLNGIRIREPVVLADGDLVQCGRLVLRYEESRPDPIR